MLITVGKKMWEGDDALYGCISPAYLLCYYAGTEYYDRVKMFLDKSKAGDFISLDERVVFNTTGENYAV